MIFSAFEDVTIISDSALISAEQLMYVTTKCSGYIFLNFLKSSTLQDSSKEQPALISGSITFLSGLKILATSAINLTPQKLHDIRIIILCFLG